MHVCVYVCIEKKLCVGVANCACAYLRYDVYFIST